MNRSSKTAPSVMHTVVRRQNTLTLNLEIVEQSDFSDTTYNSAYGSDVTCTEFIAKSLCNKFSTKIFGHKIEVLGEIWNKHFFCCELECLSAYGSIHMLILILN